MDKIKEMIQEAAVYVPFNCEGIRISHCEDECFYGQGEESGDEFQVLYEDVDLDKDLIYKFVLMNG